MNLKLELDEQGADLLAQRIVAQLYPKGVNQDQSNPINDLKNWIRAEDLYKMKLFSKTTMHKYYNKGMIGKSCIGGTSFYRIQDVIGLLEAAHVKKEVTVQLAKNMRER